VVDYQIKPDRNPRHYPSPHEFKPSRFENNSDSFLGFSIGPRACLGRAFATVEAVCFLALILRDWKVEPLLLEGESNVEWEKRVLSQVEMKMTLTLQSVPLRLVRRYKVEESD
jgi:cytochrome P450